MTGLAILTKGPVAIVLIGLQVIAFLAVTRQARRLLSPALWSGFALCLLVGLPWYLLMVHLHGALFIQGFLEANNVTRYLQAEHKETQNFLFYVPVFLGFFLPWSLALPVTFRAAAASIRAERRDLSKPQPTVFLTIWGLLVFVFFSVSQTKLVTYIFPLYPAAAILVGNTIANAASVKRGLQDTTRWAFCGLLIVIGALLAIAGIKYHIDSVTVALWLAALFGGAVLAVALPPGRSRWAVPGAAFSLALLIAWCSPSWARYAGDVSDRKAARIAAEYVPVGGSLYALGLKHPSLVYYSDRHVVFSDDRALAVRDMATHPYHVYALGPHVLKDLRNRFSLRNYRVLYEKPRLTLIQPTPQGGP
jgi:4-amino-4-deoxy-L-arabinose transferase-like glycosyltransferase